MRNQRRDGGTFLGEQYAWGDAGTPQYVPLRAVHTPGDLRTQTQANVLQGRMQVRHPFYFPLPLSFSLFRSTRTIDIVLFYYAIVAVFLVRDIT